LAARRSSGSMLVPCSLFSLASFSSLLDHTPSWYLSLDRQGGFVPDTLIRQKMLSAAAESLTLHRDVIRVIDAQPDASEKHSGE
jgi:hypothetical protein